MQQTLMNKQRNSYYDIGNTNAHQIYKGLHNSSHLRQPVDATHNLILTYNGQIALTMFDICCGGIVPGDLRYRDTSKPYLCRTQQCQFCKNSPSYRWKQDLSLSYFLDQMKAAPSLGGYLRALGDKIVDIKIADKDQAGVVHKVKLIGTQKDVILNVRELRAVLNNGHRLKSNAFTLHTSNNRLLFTGSGDGHHIGLCQWGAKNLLDQGWKLKKILSFYYPKTTLSKLIL
jgi:stage II sporulation protein D